MSEIRAIRKIVTGKQTMDGAGVKLVRVIVVMIRRNLIRFLCWMLLIPFIRRTM